MYRREREREYYSHEPPNIDLKGAEMAFPRRSPTPLAALLITLPIANVTL